MATQRSNLKRTTAPVSINSQPKVGLSVEDWDAKAPLDEQALRTVSLIKKTFEEKALPLKATSADSPVSRPSTPIPRHKPRPPSRPGTPNLGRSHALHPKQPVQTAQQFYDWFSLIDNSVTHSQESHFRAHLDDVSGHIGTCTRLVETIDEVQHEVDGMLEGWRGVEEGGRNLKDACEALLDERDRLLHLTDAIGSRLEYFQELDHATRMLNHPGESLVLQADFLDMVERVDVCIDFLHIHRNYREAEIYLLRFQQCMTRAMTLIKMYFIGSLKALTTDIAKRLYDKDVSDTAQMHLLYTRFHSVSNQVAPLLGELERRSASHPDEISSLLVECRTAYFAARKSLLVNRLAEEVKGLDPARTELVELTRAGCSYLKQLCIDEFSLYSSFFGSGKEQLYQYLESICDYLYDDLRPRILHEPRLTTLCEVCTVLQALMVLDVPTSNATDGDDEDDEGQEDSSFKSDERGREGLGKLHISRFLETLLQDAQTRLFFKAQHVVQSEIRYYVPKSEDLDYPNKLAAAIKPANGLKFKEKAPPSSLFPLPSIEKRETWYPTLRTTVWVLSQLHDFVQPAIFDDIAQETISLCRASLVAASDTIYRKNLPATILDGRLFLVRHLLILKEMTSSLNMVNRAENAPIDLSNVTDTLRDILRVTSFIPSAFTSSLNKGRADTGISDPREGIDYDLKRSCGEVITACVEATLQETRAFVDKIRLSRVGGKLHEPTRDLAVEAANNFRLNLQKELPAAAIRLRLYLEDNKTVAVLLSHIQDRIIEDYSIFREAVWSNFTGDFNGLLFSEDELRALVNDYSQNLVVSS